MNSVSLLSNNASSYYKEIIQDRRDHQDERMQDGVNSGKITGKNKERLSTVDAKTDALIEKALKDGTLTSDEFTKINKALDEQNKLIDALVKDKKSSRSARQDSSTMANQDQVLSIVYARIDSIEAKIKTGVESGKIDQDEQKKLETKLAKARDILDKAMEDGTISKGELKEFSTSTNVLTRYVTSYSRNRRYTPTARQSSAMSVQA